MLQSNRLRDILAETKISTTDRLLLLLAVEEEKPKTVTQLKALALTHGNPELVSANISSHLAAAKPKVTKLQTGWLLTTKGKSHVRAKYVSDSATPVKVVAPKLRSHIDKITQSETKAFLQEAVSCFETHHYRAAVVLSWVGAVSILQDHIITHRLADFNNEALRRDSRWKVAKTRDDLSRMKEHDFLDVLEHLSVLGKSVKQHLQNSCLTLRNSCGHPNSAIIGEHSVAAHIEYLIENVFGKF